MHGSINQLVCSECAAVAAMTPAALRALRAKRGIPCRACEAAFLRMRIMLYDDAEGAFLLARARCNYRHGASCVGLVAGLKGLSEPWSISCTVRSEPEDVLVQAT